MTAPVPVLDVGGTHVSAALATPDADGLCRAAERVELDPDGTLEELGAGLARAVRSLLEPHGRPRDTRWGVAMPDPFDYEQGIGLFDAGVGKFAALYGVDVGALLADAAGEPRERLCFVNDADAFALGEWHAGAAHGAARCVGITLGSGVGSGWLVDGVPQTEGPGVPPGGRIHQTRIDGRPVEDVMSRRAVRAAYAAATGDEAADVREIAGRAAAGDGPALQVLETALGGLGRLLGRLVADFGADVVVVGGSIARSWPLVSGLLRQGMADVAAGSGPVPPMVPATHADDAALLGAAVAALR